MFSAAFCSRPDRLAGEVGCEDNKTQTHKRLKTTLVIKDKTQYACLWDNPLFQAAKQHYAKVYMSHYTKAMLYYTQAMSHYTNAMLHDTKQCYITQATSHFTEQYYSRQSNVTLNESVTLDRKRCHIIEKRLLDYTKTMLHYTIAMLHYTKATPRIQKRCHITLPT